MGNQPKTTHSLHSSHTITTRPLSCQDKPGTVRSCGHPPCQNPICSSKFIILMNQMLNIKILSYQFNYDYETALFKAFSLVTAQSELFHVFIIIYSKKI